MIKLPEECVARGDDPKESVESFNKVPPSEATPNQSSNYSILSINKGMMDLLRLEFGDSGVILLHVHVVVKYVLEVLVCVCVTCARRSKESSLTPGCN